MSPKYSLPRRMGRKLRFGELQYLSKWVLHFELLFVSSLSQHFLPKIFMKYPIKNDSFSCAAKQTLVHVCMKYCRAVFWIPTGTLLTRVWWVTCGSGQWQVYKKVCNTWSLIILQQILQTGRLCNQSWWWCLHWCVCYLCAPSHNDDQQQDYWGVHTTTTIL